ncbi:MAG: hypothetical protein KDE09_19770, partial [Anaerolineales bacterium]|nr:hypothetical protein [Anaerolineales bacterium]
ATTTISMDLENPEGQGPAETPIVSNAYYFEDFESENSTWPLENAIEYSWGTVNSSIMGGRFEWEATAVDGWFGRIKTPSLPNVSDFELEVDFAAIEGITQFGIFFRRQNDSYYYFPVEGSSFEFTVWDSELGQWNPIVRFSEHSAIDVVGPNLLKVVARGAEFELFINDVVVVNRSDEYLGGGEVGINVAVNAGETAKLSIESFRLSPINAASQ